MTCSPPFHRVTSLQLLSHQSCLGAETDSSPNCEGTSMLTGRSPIWRLRDVGG